MKHHVHLVPIGDVEMAAVEKIRRVLEKTFDIPIKKEASVPVPNDTFVTFREQYHSPTLLTRLRGAYPSKLGFATVLGIIDRDIFVPDLNFVFGLARYRNANGTHIAVQAAPRILRPST